MDAERDFWWCVISIGLVAGLGSLATIISDWIDRRRTRRILNHLKH